jgi:hypothetical protein
VGGVPEVLPNHMINYATPEEDGKTTAAASSCPHSLLNDRSDYCHI